jgi:hypothetical protein
MPGLDPGIYAAKLVHLFKIVFLRRHVDGRVRPGHDDVYGSCVPCGESLFQRQEDEGGVFG